MLFVAQRPSMHLLSGEHGENLGRLEVGWEKVVCWSTKAAISLKRVKIEEKLLRGGYRNPPTLFRMVPPPTTYSLSFPKIGGLQPPRRNSMAIISETGKATGFKFGRYIHRVHPSKSPLKIFEKKEHGVFQKLPNFGGYPILSQRRVMLRTSNFVRIGPIGTEAH